MYKKELELVEDFQNYLAQNSLPFKLLFELTIALLTSFSRNPNWLTLIKLSLVLQKALLKRPVLKKMMIKTNINRFICIAPSAQ